MDQITEMLGGLLGGTTEGGENSATESDIFGGLTEGFQGIIDLIMGIINTIRDMVESIIGA